VTTVEPYWVLGGFRREKAGKGAVRRRAIATNWPVTVSLSLGREGVMLRPIAICFWLTFALPMAWADPVADCNQDQDLARCIKGCTLYI